MSVEPAPLASLCASISDLVEEAVFSGATDVDVTIGAPGKNGSNNPDKNQLNLFFYRFEPFGFNSDVSPKETLWLRTFCVISAFGAESTSGTSAVTAGENELRMLSHLMRFFHENPVLMLPKNTSFQWYVEFILRPLQDEQINQLWSTQGSVVYHPSVIYEMALNPIVPSQQADQAPYVGQIGAQSIASMDIRNNAFPADRTFLPPSVFPLIVNTENTQWSPAICWVSDGVCSYTLSSEMVINAGVITTPTPAIWIVGDAEDTASEFVLQTNLLQRNSVDEPVTWIMLDEISVNKKPASDYLDADNIVDASKLFDFQWPDQLNTEDNNSWQIQLLVERRITTDSGEIIKLGSNTLLVSLWTQGVAP